MDLLVGTDDILRERSSSREGYVPIDSSATSLSADASAVLRATATRETNRRAGVADSDIWALALGRAVVAFGRIEHAVTLMIRQCVPAGFGHKAARLDLAARLLYTGRVLLECGLTSQEETRWRLVCSTIEELRTQYPAISVYGAPLPGPIEFTGKFLIVRGARTAQQILLTLEQLVIVAERISAAHAQFVQAATEILTRLAAEDRLPLSTPPTVPDPA